MMALETVSGQKHGWGLIKKLGEGDAGEVFLAESLLHKKAGILKRPHHSAFSSDIIRQAAQIEQEGKILKALAGMVITGEDAELSFAAQESSQAARIGVPDLIDQSGPGTEFSERFFIVIGKAPGFDLNSLARWVHQGDSSQITGDDGQGSSGAFLRGLLQVGKVPDLLLLRTLNALFHFLESIHTHPFNIDEKSQSGILWNDIKPEHLFWDPVESQLTVIDWGNGQLLEADGKTKDRRFARSDDDAQLIEVLGKYLELTAPGLYTSLHWAELSSERSQEAVPGLAASLASRLSQELSGLRKTRHREANLLHSKTPRIEQVQQLIRVQEHIIGYGELPDYSGTEAYFLRLARQLVTSGQWDAFEQVAGLACALPAGSQGAWELLQYLQATLFESHLAGDEGVTRAMLAGLEQDWPTVLWELFALACRDDPIPAWWDKALAMTRTLYLNLGAETVSPLITVSRFRHALEAAALKLEQQNSKTAPMVLNGVAQESGSDDEGHIQRYRRVIRALREDVLGKWKQLEPDPPSSGIEYKELDAIVDDLECLDPEVLSGIQKALDQPRAKALIVMDAWKRKEFVAARRGLRLVLAWDPDRRRLLSADQALIATPAWLDQVRQGPGRDETLKEFVVRMEMQGRQLRNRIGPARWMDLILETFMKLRKGARPADLIFERPETLNEIPWLIEQKALQPAAAVPSKPVKLEREPLLRAMEPSVRGIQEGWLGSDQAICLAEPLDTWVPEARGSSARVFNGFLNSGNGIQERAVKIMRPERLDYALPLFREEAQVLAILQDLPGVVGITECGFIQLDNDQRLPGDDHHASAESLSGKVLRYGVADIHNFLASLDANASRGWLPYLALPKKNREENLMMYCDAGRTRGRFLPLQESLAMAIQLCDIFEVAHARNIVYRDHKILHYYWEADRNGIFVIDWNVAKFHPAGLSATEIQFDLVQFGARALHHIIAGRTAPGALPLGPTRPEEIEQSSHSYQARWTFDDERLPKSLMEILERSLAGDYMTVRTLRDDLKRIFLQLTNVSGNDPAGN